MIASVPFKNLDSLFSRQTQSQGYPAWLFVPFLKLAAVLELGLDHSNNTPLEVIKNINVPLLIISAQLDDQVHAQDARDLFQLASDPKELWDVHSEHDVHYFYQEEFEQEVLQFLNDNV